MIDRKEFFATVRAHFGQLSQSQVDGFNLILDEAERRRPPLHQLGYMQATSWWETGKTMQPVREAFYISKNFATAEAWRRKHLRYYPYYGRGFVQLTWDYNYRRAGSALGVDLVGFPDRALEPAIAVKIMFEGMERGWFTGKKLDDIIDEIDESDAEDLREFIAARRIINGTDKAATIGQIALVFERALKAAGYSATAPMPDHDQTVLVPAEPATAPPRAQPDDPGVSVPAEPSPAPTGFLGWLRRVWRAVFG